MKKVSLRVKVCSVFVVLVLFVGFNYVAAEEYAVKTAQLSKTLSHGGGTVYYPDSDQRHGLVLVMPGFTESKSFIEWYGPLLASNGFVTVVMDSSLLTDTPPLRANQLAAAAKDVKKKFSNIVDPTRVAYMGHSMGGGGALDAAVKDPSLKAIVPIAPWHGFPASTALNNYTKITVPTLIVSCSADFIAPNIQHSDIFYSAIPANKMQITMDGGLHSCANTDGTVPPGMTGMELVGNDQYKPAISNFVVSWLKYYMDGQPDYVEDLCGSGSVQPEVQSVRNNWCQ